MIIQDHTNYIANHPTDEYKENVRSSAQKKHSHNVWYRNILKPLIRETRTTYRDAFKRRIVHSVGVPVEEIEGLHALFKPEFRHYSPLQGMIFSYNNFVNNMYRYGDKEQEPAVALIKELFHVLPGGEIQPTHAGRNAGAHLTPALIGDIFEELEIAKAETFSERTADIFQQLLSERLADLISRHDDYRENTEKLQEDVRNAETALKEVQEKEDAAADVRQQIKEVEGDVIKANRHQIKRLKKDLKNADEDKKKEIEAEIHLRNVQIEQAEVKLAELRKNVVTSLDFKVSRKTLKRAQDAVDLERENRISLANIIAKSFCTYEVHFDEAVPSNLPKYSTTAVLQSYIWRKYDSICTFKGYLGAMDRIGALNVSLAVVMELVNSKCTDSSQSSNDSNSSESDTNNKKHGPISSLTRESDNSSRRRRRILQAWSPTRIEKAARITTGNPGNNDRPAVIVFSYVTWATYSQFPDCGETALRNLFNQLLYNPDTGKFDGELLQELKEKYYPNMSGSLIEFYNKNGKPQDCTNTAVAVEWIDVVSNLNSLRGWSKDYPTQIKYRREKDEQNIASPLRNALKVVNALFNVVDIEGAELVRQIAEQINELRDLDLKVDLSGVKNDGFGILALTADNKVRYELQSYKPVHFGFVQAERLNNGSGSFLGVGHRHFRAFRRLMRHSNVPPRAHPDDTEYFQHLALASLFVPYTLQRDTTGKFFRGAPMHYPLLFADFDSETHKQEAMKWAKTHGAQSAEVRALLERIESYVEPEFAPAKKGSNKETEE
ncbi:hypothetical protein ACA910_022554 [Epithemia clementina (nom. ined.)]